MTDTGPYPDDQRPTEGYDPDDEITFEPPPTTWAFRAMPDLFSTHHKGVYDGDTYDVLINLEFHNMRREQLRAIHVDTAEISGQRKESEEFQSGIEMRDFARNWMREADKKTDDPWSLVVRTKGERDHYERLLAEVFDIEGNSLERDMIDEFEDDPYFRWGDLY